jgi:hypothetical protein
MKHHQDLDDNQISYDMGHDYELDEHPEALRHRKEVRRMLEERLERKRLREELEDEFDDEFDWSVKDK